jgi:methylene-tetrahydromethanopterin dehydrogenase
VLERKRLLYLVSSDPHVSPFDVNMAYDAGFDAVVPYAGMTAGSVRGFVQDIMFSRGPKGARASSLFFSGSDMPAAEQMLRAAQGALFDPFRVGLMIDPRGGYTTAAALVAKGEALAAARGLGDPGRLRALVMAGTGTVGKSAAAMLGRDGSRVVLTSRRADGAEAAAREVKTLFGVTVEGRAAPAEIDLARLAAEADLILATGTAGVRLLSGATLRALRGPRVLADVNAVPPAGIEGLDAPDDGREIAPGLFGLGALAIGGLKFKVEAALLADLLSAEKAPVLDAAAARRRAGEILAAR